MPPVVVEKRVDVPSKGAVLPPVASSFERSPASVQVVGDIVPRIPFAALDALDALDEICGENSGRILSQSEQIRLLDDARFNRWIDLAKALEQPANEYSVTRSGASPAGIRAGIAATMDRLESASGERLFDLLAKGVIGATEFSEAIFVFTDDAGHSRYLRPLKTLGSGASGTVTLVEVGGADNTVDVVAMKTFRYGRGELYRSEVDTMTRGSTITPYIAAPKEVIVLPQSEVAVIFMPFREGSSLGEFSLRVASNRVDLNDVVAVTRKLLKVGLHLAERGLLPTDTHDGNILVDAGGMSDPSVHFLDFASVGSQVTWFRQTLQDFFQSSIDHMDAADLDSVLRVSESGIRAFCRGMSAELNGPRTLEEILTAVSDLADRLGKTDLAPVDTVLEWSEAGR